MPRDVAGGRPTGDGGGPEASLSPTPPLVLLGCGYTLTALAHRARATGRDVLASTRDLHRRLELEAIGVIVERDVVALAARADGAHVVISVPPDAGLDAALAATLDAHRPARLVYLSSTGVYGDARGEIDETTPVDEDGAGAGRLRAERWFGELGAVSLRVAAIYGPGRGVHDRVRHPGYRLPGDGSGYVSRVHVDDLVSAIEVALDRAAPGDVLCVADDEPAPLREVVGWLCERLGRPFPPSIPLEQAHRTLRSDRRVRNARLRALGWAPRWPSWRQGFAALIDPETT